MVVAAMVTDLSREGLDSRMDLETKALLLSIGTVQADGLLPRGPVSTAGPGAGEGSIFFQSGSRMVRLSLTESSPLRLVRLTDAPGGDEAALLLDGREVARGRTVAPLLHCPEQAYITVSERCIYDCKFCAVPRLLGGIKADETVQRMVEQAAQTGLLQAISLTSGVEVSPRQEGEKVARIVRSLKGFGVPVGVSISPYPGVNRILRDAGAVEVKYNLECADRELFARICPGISWEEIMDALEEAVAVFGRGRVFSNIIVGLGESDRSLKRVIDDLTEKGIMPVLRAVYPHPLRAGAVEMNRPSVQRLLELARYLRAALDRAGLDGRGALTGCYRCTGCDLTPGRDL